MERTVPKREKDFIIFKIVASQMSFNRLKFINYLQFERGGLNFAVNKQPSMMGITWEEVISEARRGRSV